LPTLFESYISCDIATYASNITYSVFSVTSNIQLTLDANSNPVSMDLINNSVVFSVETGFKIFAGETSVFQIQMEYSQNGALVLATQIYTFKVIFID